ncbi:hypothetical protein [Saccharomonospora sp.]|uniref:hypothetical protein n=1 Tax=Saccharomonospora sp. TaxID=33913 RepID=UPI0026253297|nr:hypothetical protein [Saccharomonospora sp.]
MSWISGSCRVPSPGYRSGPKGLVERDDEVEDRFEKGAPGGSEADVEGGER